MGEPTRKAFTVIAALAAVTLPVVLVYSAVRTFRALDDQRSVYLRSRVGSIAAHLETLAPGEDVSTLTEEEVGLADVAILDPPVDASKDPLAPLWSGRELFRTERLTLEGEPVMRAWVPFHGPAGLRVARIDIAERSADFLVGHARHNLWISVVTAAALVALALVAVWSTRRAARAEHLATLGKMSAVLAHEIRNPLGTIKGFAQLLGEQLNGAHAELLSPILSETQRLESLVKDLLLYGRPASPVVRTLAAQTVIDGMRAHAGRLEAPLHAEAATVTFRSDPNLLEQALLNLVRNAAEAVRDTPDGCVWLRAEPSGGGVLFRVSDNGPGLSLEARRRLYEPFYTSKAFGTGLGLAITRKLVESLGGTLRIADRQEGGTVAEVLLPG